MRTQITFTNTTIWKDRKRANHKVSTVTLDRDMTGYSNASIKYWLLCEIDDGKIDDDMVAINRVEIAE